MNDYTCRNFNEESTKKMLQDIKATLEHISVLITNLEKK